MRHYGWNRKPRRYYGWKRQLPDQRDLLFAAADYVKLSKLPAKIDLRDKCPGVYDQLDLGSCTAQLIAFLLQFDQMKQGKPAPFTPSRLFIYYNERVMEGTVNSDSGAEIRDGIKSVNQLGAPPESDWPYIVKKFKRKPPAKAYAHALDNQALKYASVRQNLDQMRGCLAAGFPIGIGFSVYESFETATVAKNGVAPMPGKDEEILGGHAVGVVGYDNSSSRFLLRNSWGAAWGMKGYFTLPYAYLLDGNLASDFWQVQLVE